MLKYVKKACIDADLTFSKLSKCMGVSRVTLYNKLKKNDKETFEAVKKFFQQNCNCK